MRNCQRLKYFLESAEKGGVATPPFFVSRLTILALVPGSRSVAVVKCLLEGRRVGLSYRGKFHLNQEIVNRR